MAKKKKEKKGGKHLKKKELVEMLLNYFRTKPNEAFSLKQLFQALNGIDSNFSSPVECLVFDLDKLLGVGRETEWKYQQYKVNFLHDYFFFLTDQPNLPTKSPNP